MSRESFAQKLVDLKDKVLTMGSLVESIIEMAVRSLKTQDLELAQKVYEKDDEIDALELEIEHECMMMLALQQPLAKDLRTIASILKIITDLERMGDNAVNIAELVLEIGTEPLITSLVNIPKMSVIAQEMIKMSLDSFVHEDIDLAVKAAQRDEEVDELYETVIADILGIITARKETTEQGSKLLFIGRYLERIADHSTNICERTVYMITGELRVLN